MICYVAGPYTAPTREAVQANIDAAEAVGKKMLHLGYCPAIPHRLTAFWDEDPQFAHLKHGDWMTKVCLPLLEKCDAIVMVPGWENSPGSVMEHQHATARNIPIFYHQD